MPSIKYVIELSNQEKVRLMEIVKKGNSLQIATPPGQQGRNSRSSRDIIPGQQKLVKKRDNIISPAVFHRQERREAQASACGKLPAVTKAAPQCGLS